MKYSVRGFEARSVQKKQRLSIPWCDITIRLINSLLFGKSKNIPIIHREFADNFTKNNF